MQWDRNLERPFLYTPYYCEENVWHLCQQPQFVGLETKVVFISNARRQCPLWHQRAAVNPAEPVLWDYHVILICKMENTWYVYDLDTALPMPIPVVEYIHRTFAATEKLDLIWHPIFRVVDAEEYARTLSSDRSHMLDEYGNWMQLPPNWPCIFQAPKTNLQQFIDVTDTSIGKVATLVELRAQFG